MHPNTSPALILVLGVVFLLVALIAASYVLPARRKRESSAHMEELKQEAQAYFERCEQNGFPAPATNLVLKRGEEALLDEESILFESRAYRVSGGAGTRIGRVWVGGGVSESQQRLKQIDSGRVTLTTMRLVFDGSMENRSIRLADIMSVEQWADAIEIGSHKRAKSLILRVNNPWIWSNMVKQFANHNSAQG
jgi:hypothetical protein